MSELDVFCHFAVKDGETCDVLRTHLPDLPLTPRSEPAAVLVALQQAANGTESIVLTRRSDALPHHAGQVSFPGGKVDAHDADVIAAALRETDEEIGIAAGDIAVFGTLPMLPTLTGFDIFPVLARLYSDHWQADTREVAEIFTVPAALALDMAQYRQRTRNHRGFTLTTLELPYHDYDIWGATAAILYRLAMSFAKFNRT
ncbi:MAG: CoA pyrophosphatase [Neisseria sp.]|nr:CoA pyrophosphatase [Neisseria sp.]